MHFNRFLSFSVFMNKNDLVVLVMVDFALDEERKHLRITPSGVAPLQQPRYTSVTEYRQADGWRRVSNRAPLGLPKGTEP